MARIKPRYKKKDGKKTLTGYVAVFYDPDRHPKEKSVTLRTTDRAAARRKLTDYERRYSMGEWDPWQDRAPEEGLSFAKAAERFVAASAGRKRESTRGADERALDAFAASLPAAIPLAGVEPRHVDRYLHGLRVAGRSPNTLVTYYTRLNRFFKWCVREGLVRYNPCTDVERPKQAKREKVALSREQFDRLVRTVEADLVLQGDRLKAGEVRWMLDLLHIGVATGLRRSELCAMRWSWVSLELKELTVRRSDGFVPKSGHERTIPLRGKALEVFGRLHDERTDEDDSAFVLRSTRGRKGDAEGLNPEYVSSRFLHYRKKARLPKGATLHSLRHTFCTWLIRAGTTVPAVQRLAGHADIKTTMGYVHVDRQDLHEAVEGVFG